MKIRDHRQSLLRYLIGSLILSLGLLSGAFLFAVKAHAEDWPKFGRDLANDAHSAEAGITSKNVSTLQSKWTFQTGGEISGTPAIATVGGKHILYIGSWSGVFYALDAVTGQQLWTFTVDYVGGRCTAQTPWCRIGSSPAVDTAHNLVLFGSYSGYLYALNAATGALVWKTQVGDSLVGYEVWASPSVYRGQVYIGVSAHGDEPCLQGGSVNSYDETTGQLVWSFNTIDQSTCPGGSNCVGGSVWSSLAIDSDNGIVYAGTGNPGATCVPPSQNAGLYPDSILALDASSGKLLNYFQAIADDHNDKDFGASPVLMSTGWTNQCTHQGGVRYWVGEGSKDGYFYTLERDSQGLKGTPAQQNAGGSLGFIATAGVTQVAVSTACGGNLKRIQYVNGIFDGGSGGTLFVYQQMVSGKVSQRAAHKVASASFYGAPALIADIGLFVGADGNFYAMDYNGNVLNTIAIGAPLFGGVSISDGRVYFGDTNGAVHCYSPNGT